MDAAGRREHRWTAGGGAMSTTEPTTERTVEPTVERTTERTTEGSAQSARRGAQSARRGDVVDALLAGEDVVDVRPIEMIHRGHDGAIAFARKRGGKFEQLWGLPANDLSLFGSVVEQIERDGYFSIHGFQRFTTRSRADPRFTIGRRTHDSLRWLTAAFVDIDGHNFGRTFGDVVGRMLNLQDEGVFPTASLIVRSGRGAWFLWLIADEPGGRKPVRAWNEKVQAWKRIQSELLRRTAQHLLPADANAADIARVMRVPGSINSRAPIGKRVKFVPLLDENGEPITYGLDQLAALLGVRPSRQRKLAQTSEADPERRERGFAGRRKLAEKRLTWLRRLGELRGKFKEGTRHNATLMYAKFVLESVRLIDGVPVDANGERLNIERSVRDFIRTRCDSGGHPVEAHDVLSGDRFDKLRWTDEQIVARLQITDDEARAVGCPTLAEARSRRERSDRRMNRNETRTARRELIAGILRSIEVATPGTVPTLETLQAILAENGIEASKPTLGRDWDDLTGSGRAPRRRMKPGKLRSSTDELLTVDERQTSPT
jgi:hypothetical protein